MQNHKLIKTPVAADRRRGIILVLAAALMISILAITALVVDLGYILVIRSQMQTAADAAALSAGMELSDGLGPGAIQTQSVTVTKAQSAGQSVASSNRMLDRSTAFLSPSRDLTFGHRYYNNGLGKWDYQWGTAPFDTVKATIRRDQAPANANAPTPADGSLKLFFAQALGNKTASYHSDAIATLKPAGGFRIIAGSNFTAEILPITLDQGSWNSLMNGVGTDQYAYDPVTGAVTTGADGIKEVSIYPNGSANLPPGNRGTVDFGSANNSTADLSRQIRYGLNAYDLSFFPNSEIKFTNGILIVNGDTGISAAIKDDLDAIKGKPRAMPLFTAVSGPGNNAMYTLVKFVGVRIMFVRLTGSASTKTVIVQPATLVSKTAIAVNTGTGPGDSVFAPIRLVQ